MTGEDVTRSSVLRAAPLAIGSVIAALLIGAGLWASTTHSAAPVDPAALESVAAKALDVNNRVTMLPPGVRPGHMTSAERQAVRSQISDRFSEGFAGSAFTNRLNGLLSWADRIAVDPTQPRTLEFRILDVSFDPPVIRDDAATVTGTYQMDEKQAYDTPGGVTATYGGRYTNSFALELQRRGATWVVTAFSEQPLAFVPNPAMESNLDIDPAPGATKPPIGAPVPVNPAP